MTTSIRAIVLGATGAIGADVRSQLLLDDRFSVVTSLVRRPMDSKSPKDKLVVVDYDALNGDVFKDHDVCFCCLGTTRRDAGSDEAFRKVDLTYVLDAATKAKAAGVKHFSIVTAQGSDSKSMFLYMRTKGEVEDKLKTMGFEQLTIFEPGLLDRGDKSRFIESVGNFFMSGIKVKTVADALIADAVHHFRQPTKSTPIMVHNGNSTITNVAATDAGAIAARAAAAVAAPAAANAASTSSTAASTTSSEPDGEKKKKKKSSHSHSHSHSHGSHSHSHSHEKEDDNEEEE